MHLGNAQSGGDAIWVKRRGRNFKFSRAWLYVARVVLKFYVRLNCDCFCIEIRKPFSFYIRNPSFKIRIPAVQSLPPSSPFLSTFLPPCPVATWYVTQHDIILSSSGNSRQLAPPSLVPPSSLPPSQVDIGPRIRKGLTKTKGSLFERLPEIPPMKVASLW